MGHPAGVLVAPAVIPVVANGVSYSIGYLQGTFATGTGVLLGKWISANENYIIDAEESGLGYFNLGRAYKVFDYLGDAWVANKGFLDSVIARGLPIYLNNSPICATGGYARELEYLFSAGVPNQGFVFVW